MSKKITRDEFFDKYWALPASPDTGVASFLRSRHSPEVNLTTRSLASTNKENL